jgi:hypothetical protein
MRSTCLGRCCTLDELLADLDVLAVGDEQARTLAHRVGVLLATVVRDEHDLAALSVSSMRDPAGRLGDRRDTLGGAGLEQLDDTRQTLRDVVTGHTTGVEGTHRQLGAGLTDRLGRDDADGLADVDQLAGRQGAAVAHGAGADLAVAGEDRADLDLVDAGAKSASMTTSPRSMPASASTVAVDLDVLGQRPGVDRGLDVVVDHPLTGALVDAAIGMARPRSVPQSSSRMMTSCDTSTRRRVR